MLIKLKKTLELRGRSAGSYFRDIEDGLFTAPVRLGKRTGPVTEDGRSLCATAKTVHGYETKTAREYRPKKFHEMRQWSRLLKLR